MLRPLFHFLWIGSLLFALDRLVLASPRAPEPVEVSAQRLTELQAGFLARAGRPPSDSELEALLRAEVDDELLYREALALGFLRDDPVVLRRLVQNMRFAGADPERDDASLFAEALALHMERSDPVVRRRLVQRMRLLVESRALAEEPSEAALRAWYEAHPERFTDPERVRLVQLFFDGEPAGEALRALAKLRGVGADPPPGLGEPFLHAARQPLQSQPELAARFGAELARAAFELPQGVWSGPVRSSYGEHLLYLQERTPASLRPLESVRAELRLAVLADRRQQALAEALASLRQGVRVVVAEHGAP